MTGFTPINDLNLAAIIATTGCPVKVDSINDVRSGAGKTTLHFPTNLIPKVLAQAAPGSGAMAQKSILGLLKSGQLAKIDPHHYALDCARALINRERLLDWVKQGQQMALARVDGINRCIYVKTDLVVPAIEQFPTQNIKLAAALAVIGAPVCKIVGTASHHTFYIGRYTEALAGDRLDAYELARQLHAGEVPQEHPLRWAYQTLKNRERLLDLINSTNPKLYIRRLNSARNASAIVAQNEDKKTFARHLNAAARHCGNF
jgi:hypothetical protein